MKKATFIATLLALCTASSIRAQSDSIRLDEIVVTGIQSRVSRDNLPSTTTVITRREIEESGQPSLLSALSGRVPGLFITERGLLGFGVGSTSAGAINLRGIGDGTRLLVLIDGNPQYMGIMGHHLPDAYTSAAVERVEITRAPASLVGGSNAMGGAINIITRGAGKEGWSGGASLSFGAYDTRALQAHAAGKGDGWETFLSLENSHTDGHRAGKSARFHLTAGHAKLALRLTPLLRLAGSVNLSLYETQNPGLLADPILDNVGDILRGVANISLENRWKHGHGALALFYNFGDHEINEGYYPPTSPSVPKQPRDYLFRSRDHNYGLRLHQTILPYRGASITAGIDYKNFGGRAWDDLLDPATPANINVDTTLREIAAYLVLEQTIGKYWILNAGLRLDHNQHFGVEWIPRAAIAYAPFRDGAFRLSIAKGFRSPNIRDLFYKAAWAAANPDLEPESMINYELSADQLFMSGRLHAEIALFISRGKNLIIIDRRGFPPTSDNSGRFRHGGIELSARYRLLENLQLQGNYSFLDARDPVLYAPARQLNLSASYHLGRWHLSAEYRRVSGLHSSAVAEETFALLNASAAYHPCRWIGITLRGNNIANTGYQIIDGYPMPGATVTGGVNLSF